MNILFKYTKTQIYIIMKRRTYVSHVALAICIDTPTRTNHITLLLQCSANRHGLYNYYSYSILLLLILFINNNANIYYRIYSLQFATHRRNRILLQSMTNNTSQNISSCNSILFYAHIHTFQPFTAYAFIYIIIIRIHVYVYIYFLLRLQSRRIIIIITHWEREKEKMLYYCYYYIRISWQTLFKTHPAVTWVIY